MSTNQVNVEEARTIGRQLAHRLIDDADFRRQLKESPSETLTAAGLPEEAVPDFMREFPVSPEVSGYILEADYAGCANTCFLITVQN